MTTKKKLRKVGKTIRKIYDANRDPAIKHFRANSAKYLGKAEDFLKQHHPEHYERYKQIKGAAEQAAAHGKKHGIDYSHMHSAIKSPAARQKLRAAGISYLHQKVNEGRGGHVGGVNNTQPVQMHHHVMHALEKYKKHIPPSAQRMFGPQPTPGFGSLGGAPHQVGLHSSTGSNYSFH